MRRFALQLLVLLATSSIATAGQTKCPQHFLGGQAPDILNPKMQVMTHEICYGGYGTMHSGITKGPLYSAEYLTRDRIRQAKGLVRNNEFHPDPDLAFAERSNLWDFTRTGFDRGHIAPSADMPSEQSQYEAFSLANIVPQDPENNRGVWSDVEGVTRHLTNQRGGLYVVTGPLFYGNSLRRIKGRVLVPTHLFKAVWDDRRREGGAYLVENTANGQAQRMSISQVEQLAVLDLFPSLKQGQKERLMALPEPKPFKERKRRR